MYAIAERHSLEEVEFQSLNCAVASCSWNVEPEVPQEIGGAALWIRGILPVKQAVVIGALAFHDEVLAVFIKIRRIHRVWVSRRIERADAAVVALAADSIVVIDGPV